jgi:hypothetical protein
MAGFVLGATAGFLDEFAGEGSDIVEGFLSRVFEDLFPGLVGGQEGDLTELGGELEAELIEVGLLLLGLKLGGFDFLLAGAESIFVGGEAFELAVDDAFAIGDAGFQFLQLATAVGEVTSGLFPEFKDFLRSEETGFAGGVFGIATGFGEQEGSAVFEVTAGSGGITSEADEEEDGDGGEEGGATDQEDERSERFHALRSEGGVGGAASVGGWRRRAS